MTPADATSTPNPEDIHLHLDERLRQAWERYSKAVYLLLGIVAAGILAKSGIDYLARQKELDIEAAYAACTTPESFKAFAAEHRNHPLGALVELKMADETFMGGKAADSIPAYEKAIADLPAGPFQARAKLGLAVAKLRSGKADEGAAALKALLSDDTQYKLVRCEAGYDLAEVAMEKGNAAEVQRLAEQLLQIDPSNPFAERAFALRSQAGGVPAAKR